MPARCLLPFAPPVRSFRINTVANTLITKPPCGDACHTAHAVCSFLHDSVVGEPPHGKLSHGTVATQIGGVAIGTSEPVGIWPRDINQCTQTTGMDVLTHTKHEFINAVTHTCMLNIRFSIIFVLWQLLTELSWRGMRARRGPSAVPLLCRGCSSWPRRATKQRGATPVAAIQARHRPPAGSSSRLRPPPWRPSIATARVTAQWRPNAPLACAIRRRHRRKPAEQPRP